MKSNLEWKKWGEVDPLFVVATGFSQIEFRTFRVRSNGSYHDVVYATKGITY